MKKISFLIIFFSAAVMVGNSCSKEEISAEIKKIAQQAEPQKEGISWRNYAWHGVGFAIDTALFVICSDYLLSKHNEDDNLPTLVFASITTIAIIQAAIENCCQLHQQLEKDLGAPSDNKLPENPSNQPPKENIQPIPPKI